MFKMFVRIVSVTNRHHKLNQLLEHNCRLPTPTVFGVELLTVGVDSL